MSAFEVRPSSLEDVPGITRIYRHAVLTGTATFELDAPTEIEIAARRAALIDAGYPYLVATRDNTVLGYSYAGPYRPRAAYRSTVENSVYVDPQWHRVGVGTMLLGTLIERASRDFRQMIAVIGDAQNVASIELHKRAGFESVGTLRAVGWKFETWLDTVIMQRALSNHIDAGRPAENRAM